MKRIFSIERNREEQTSNWFLVYFIVIMPSEVRIVYISSSLLVIHPVKFLGAIELIVSGGDQHRFSYKSWLKYCIATAQNPAMKTFLITLDS